MKVNFVARLGRDKSSEIRKECLESDYHLKKLGIKNVVCHNNPPYAEDSFEIDDNAESWSLHLYDSCLESGDVSIPEKNLRFHIPAHC